VRTENARIGIMAHRIIRPEEGIMSELITPELVLLDQNLGETKFDVISKLAHAVVDASRATDYDQLYAAAEARESKTDTGIPGGIAIPHCRSAAVTEPTLAMARPNPGVSFGAKDGPADLIFFIAAPDGADQEHLKLLSTLARSLMKKSFTASLREAQTPEEIVDLVNDALGTGAPKKAPASADPAASAAQKAREAVNSPPYQLVHHHQKNAAHPYQHPPQMPNTHAVHHGRFCAATQYNPGPHLENSPV